jgi:hypothetical protein
MAKRFVTAAGYWEIGIDEIKVASLDQPVSIPVTFYVYREWADAGRSVCITVGLKALLVFHVKYGGRSIEMPSVQEFANVKIENLGRPSPQSVVSIGDRQFYRLMHTVTVSVSQLVDPNVIMGRARSYGAESWEFRDVYIVLTWPDCGDPYEPMRGESIAEVRIWHGGRPSVEVTPRRAGRHWLEEILANPLREEPPAGGVKIEVVPPSGNYARGTLVRGFTAELRVVTTQDSADLPELSFALGVGRTFEEVESKTAEVELLDRNGVRVRKVKAKNLRIVFRASSQVVYDYTPIIIYLEVRANGMPVARRVWVFGGPL